MYKEMKMNIRNIYLSLTCLLIASLCSAKSMINCTSKSDLSSLITKNSMVVVDFHGESFCMPCKKMSKPFAELADEFTTVQFVKIDTEAVHDFDNEIRSVPAFYFYKDGKKVADFVGAKGKDHLKNIIKSSFGL